MTKARRFNQTGLELFRGYVALHRTEKEPPKDLLWDDATSEALPVALEIGELAADSKYDLGVMIVTGTSDENLPSLLSDDNLWPWLSLNFSDKTMPLRKGMRFIGHQQRHIITNATGWAKYDHGHRHLVRGAVQSVLYFDEYARVLLGSVSEHTKMEENILSRKSIYPLAYMKNAVEAYYALFYDSTTNKARKGAAGMGAGGIIDFVRSLSQLDVNYDIASLSSQRLLQLLPSSFAEHKPAASKAS